MPDYSGSLPAILSSRALWLTPLLPLVAAIVCAVWRDPRARRVALVACFASLALVVWHVLELVGAGPGARALSIPWNLLRIGSLDVAFSIELDAASSALAIAALATGCVLVHGAEDWRELAGACLCIGSLLLVALGDGFVLLSFGWMGLALGAFLWSELPFASLSLAPLLAGALLLFWALGGVWTSDGGFVPDFHARLVAVQSADAKPLQVVEAKRPSDGFLTLTALPGSRVRLGGADLCIVDARGEPGGLGTGGRGCRVSAVTPFVRVPVPSAIHDVYVATGPGTTDHTVEKVRVSPGIETHIVLTGSSLGFREVAQQLVLRDLSGAEVRRASLSKKDLRGARVVTLASVLLLLAALIRAVRFRVALSARPREAGLLAGAFLGSAALLGARVAPIASLAPSAASVLSALAALVALLLALRAAAQDQRSAVVVCAVASQVAIAIAGAAMGAGSAAFVHVAAVLPAAAVLTGTTDRRALLVGCVAATGAPLPAIGVFWSRDDLLRSAFFASEGVLVPGWVAFALSAAASLFASYALWKIVLAVKPSKVSSRAPLVLALVAVAVGVVLAPPLAPWLDAREMPPADRTVRLAVSAIAFVLPFVGWLLARGGRKLPGLEAFRKDLEVPPLLERAGRLVRAIDRRFEQTKEAE